MSSPRIVLDARSFADYIASPEAAPRASTAELTDPARPINKRALSAGSAENAAMTEKQSSSPVVKTFTAKPAAAQIERKWWVVDVGGQPLGRAATLIATVLRGKNKVTFTPHVDTGDFVIVVNASKVKLTGRKLEQKMYSRHSGEPGGFRQEAYGHLIERMPELPIEKAVRGMLPKNVLGRQLLTKLKVYGGPDHPHAAQKPEVLAVSA
jgi:large subunit ribosomal protein L13